MSDLEPLYRLPHPLADRVGRTVFLAWLALLTGTLWVVTQLFAARAQYHAALGEPWLRGTEETKPVVLLGSIALALIGVAFIRRKPRVSVASLAGALLLLPLMSGHLYTPLHAVAWYARFGDLPSAKGWWWVASRVTFGVGAAATLVALVATIVLSRRWRQPADIHGSAAWATEKDVLAAGLLHPHLHSHPHGIFLGVWPGRRARPLVDTSKGHVLLFAPTRSGKGVGVVVPNLLSWAESALITDIKGENWQLTAGYRSAVLGQRCLRFDPTDSSGTCARYNPLREIRLGDHEVRDAQNLAEILVDPNGEKRTRDHWDRTAHALLTALILHVLYDRESEKTLAACADVLASGNRYKTSGVEALKRMQVYPHMGTQPHPYVARLAQETLMKPSEEQGSVLSTALSYLALYRDPILAANIAESDFALEDLMNDTQPTSLYLTIPPTDLARTRVFVRLLLNQFITRLTERLELRDGQAVLPYRHRLLLLLDELPALGHLAFLQHALAFVAGYGIRALLIAQDLSQLHAAYSRDESLTSNTETRLAFTPNRTETAELLSKMVGDTTIHQRRKSLAYTGGASFGGGLRASYSNTESRRPLLAPDEAMRFPPDQAILLTAGARPVRALRFRYHEDPEFSRRSLAYPPPACDRRAIPGPWAALPALSAADPSPDQESIPAPVQEPSLLLPQPKPRPRRGV